ncbi:MAG: histidine--tRNA ligase [Deltaproteobacteria bacterium]|nr:histidine--tRNA ligase [Deltaproteobacteria bacterium]
MAKTITKLTGFPEWLPEERMVELELLKQMSAIFELYGFTSIETRAVEPLDRLLQKGESDKEMYLLRRLQAEDEASDSKLGLHFDLTVPFARYVLEHKDKLQFPFKRYQIQKVWRGERPQDGRFREFYQADIDVIGEGELPLFFDAEMPRILYQVLSKLPIPAITLHINNRKIMEGYYRGLGIENPLEVFRLVDKLDKIGEAKVQKLLQEALSMNETTAKKCLDLGRIRTSDLSFVDQVKMLGVKNEILSQGLEDLASVMNDLKDLPKGSIVADLHIARGLDYYTGTVYEGMMKGFENLGAVCSGGRYDNLASEDEKNKLPGVGVSIGLSRILSKLFASNYFEVSRRSPTCVLVALPAVEQLSEAIQLAETLRSRGIAAEVFPEALKYGKQIRYAEKKGIPFVWFLEKNPQGLQAVKDIRSGTQVDADLSKWVPPTEDLKPQIKIKK